MADPTPKPSPYTLVHAAGLPCGADDAGAVGIGETWGTDCPAALREALEEERARPAGPEAGEPPRHLVIALSQMQRAFESRDRRAFGTINEYLQPVADAALAWIREAESATPGPHIPPALMRRVEALGFTPGSSEPVGWLLGYVEGMAALLTTAQGERDALDKLVGDLQNEVRARIIDGLTALGVSDADYVIDGSGSDGDEIDLTSAEVDQGFSVVGEMVSDLRARVAELEATLAARSAGGGGS